MAIVLTATGVAGFLEAISAAFAFESVTTSAWAEIAAVASTAQRGAIHMEGRLNMVSPRSTNCQAGKLRRANAEVLKEP
ncbi:MAG: hypothetical protein ABI580_03280 [Burkholderiaceae bacterium]